jgi:hypothetical protein
MIKNRRAANKQQFFTTTLPMIATTKLAVLMGAAMIIGVIT